METPLEEMRAGMTFSELVILHELVYDVIDEENRKKKENDQSKNMEKV